MNRSFAVALGLVVMTAHAQAAMQDFPFDRELLLQAAPMRPGKRMPSVTIESNGRAVIDLWCRSVSGRVVLGEGTILVVSDVAPQDLTQMPLPSMLSVGQCTEPRIAADTELLAELSTAASWRQEGDIVVIAGGQRPLRFRPAGN